MPDIDLARLEAYIRYAEHLDVDPSKSFTKEELARLWNLEVYRSKAVIRRLRRAGFIRRTRGGRYKLTFAGVVLVHIYKKTKAKR